MISRDITFSRPTSQAILLYDQELLTPIVLSRDGKFTTQPVSLTSGCWGLTRPPERESHVSYNESE